MDGVPEHHAYVCLPVGVMDVDVRPQDHVFVKREVGYPVTSHAALAGLVYDGRKIG